MLARGTKITQLPAQKCSTLWWYSRIPTSLTLEPWWFSGQNVRSSIWFLLLPSENVHWKCRCAAHQCIIKIKEQLPRVGLYYTLNVRSRGKQFCFPKSPDVSRDEVEGNIRTGGKTKLTGFPRDLTLSVLLYFQTFTSTATRE